MRTDEITLGSLFDGIGGFPFCSQIMGARPVWAAEINPFGAAVTHHRFPDMLHFGDVSKISGAALPPVDIITFGSPCQDLSVAGKRAGLDGERSGLFRDAIRIVYEMREETNGRYPTYIVWENVPGAFSSHNGRDFQEVLQEITKADIPMPESGRWANAGMVRGGEVCVAWRVLDAQFWGVPQRRKRIYLIGSFGNNSAGEILFKRDSVRRYLTPRGKERETTSEDSGVCTAPRDRESGQNCVDVLTFDTRGNGDGRTVSPIVGDHNNRVTDYTSLLVYNNNSFGGFAEGIGTIRRCEGKQPFNIVCNQGGIVDCEWVIDWTVRRLTPIECERLQGYPDGWTELPEIKDMTNEEYALFLRVWQTDREIRGISYKTLPDKKRLVKWYNKLESDTSRYQALGNSLAIPCALRVIGGIVDYMKGTCKQI